MSSALLPHVLLSPVTGSSTLHPQQQPPASSRRSTPLSSVTRGSGRSDDIAALRHLAAASRPMSASPLRVTTATPPGLTVEAVHRLNLMSRSPGELVMRDEDSGSDSDTAIHTINTTDVTHQDIVKLSTMLPADTSSDDDRSNDSFTCSEFDGDNGLGTGPNPKATKVVRSLSKVREKSDSDWSERGKWRDNASVISNADTIDAFFAAHNNDLEGGGVRQQGQGQVSSDLDLDLDRLITWKPAYDSFASVLADIGQLHDTGTVTPVVKSPSSAGLTLTSPLTLATERTTPIEVGHRLSPRVTTGLDLSALPSSRDAAVPRGEVRMSPVASAGNRLSPSSPLPPWLGRALSPTDAVTLAASGKASPVSDTSQHQKHHLISHMQPKPILTNDYDRVRVISGGGSRGVDRLANHNGRPQSAAAQPLAGRGGENDQSGASNNRRPFSPQDRVLPRNVPPPYVLPHQNNNINNPRGVSYTPPTNNGVRLSTISALTNRDPSPLIMEHSAPVNYDFASVAYGNKASLSSYNNTPMKTVHASHALSTSPTGGGIHEDYI